jgi:hypothetical protein
MDWERRVGAECSGGERGVGSVGGADGGCGGGDSGALPPPPAGNHPYFSTAARRSASVGNSIRVERDGEVSECSAM